MNETAGAVSCHNGVLLRRGKGGRVGVVNMRFFSVAAALLLAPLAASASPETPVPAMSITVNIYYTGENGAARKFAEEMTAKIRSV